MFSWIKKLFSNTLQSARGADQGRCPRCGVISRAGATACAACHRDLSLPLGPEDTWRQRELREAAKKPATAPANSAPPAPHILILHPGYHRGFVVTFEGVLNLAHAFTLFQHAFLNKAALPFATEGPPKTVAEAGVRRKVLEGWPGPEPHPSAEVLSVPASHLGGCVHGNAWDYCPWFALKSEGLFQDLFIGGEHAPAEVPQFEGQRIILLGRAQGLRTWVFDMPPDRVAHVRVIRTLSTEEVDDWCGRLTRAGAGLQLEGKAGCAICTHRLATLARSAEPTAPADGGLGPDSS